MDFCSLQPDSPDYDKKTVESKFIRTGFWIQTYLSLNQGSTRYYFPKNTSKIIILFPIAPSNEAREAGRGHILKGLEKSSKMSEKPVLT